MGGDVSLLLQGHFEQEEPPRQEALSVGIFIHPNKPITPPGGCGFQPRFLPSVLLPHQKEGGSGGSFCPSGSGLLAKHLQNATVMESILHYVMATQLRS